jgi:hypothetical protein
MTIQGGKEMNKLLKISMPALLILGLMLGTGCAAEGPEAVMAPPAPAPQTEDAASKTEQYRGGEGQAYEADIERKIVKTGYLTLEVDDTVEAMNGVAAIAKELGGYVVSSNKREDDSTTYGTVSIRVPAERFDEAFDRLRKLAIAVPYENTDSRDVTEEYTDLEAQLRNLEATEAQYLALLEKAETVEDILNVQRALSDVRGEIERIKGRMQYLERTSDMSLIEVSLQETKPLGATGWSASETFKSAVRGLITFGKVLANIAIWLVIFCPIWIPIIFLIRFLRRRRKAKA